MNVNDPEPAGDLPEVLRTNTAFLLSWMGQAGAREFAAVMTEVELTPHDLGVLSLLDAGPQKQAALSRQLALFAPAMVAIVNRLESKGLAERRPHPTDRRAVEVHLLPAGRARLAEAMRLTGAASDRLFAPLDAEERRQLHSLLLRLAIAHRAAPPPRTSPPPRPAPHRTEGGTR